MNTIKKELRHDNRMLKGRSSRILRKEFPELKKLCKDSPWAPSCYHGSVGHGRDIVEKYINGQETRSYEKYTEKMKKCDAE